MSAANVEDYRLTLFEFAGLWRLAAVDANIIQGNGRPNVSIQADDRIWASFTDTHWNVSSIRITYRGSTHLASTLIPPR